MTWSRGAAAANLREPRLREGADDGARHPALEIARDVLDRLAAAEDHVRRRFDDLAAQLAHGDDERDARAERRLLEEQRDVSAGQWRRLHRPSAALALERPRQSQQPIEPVGREIEDREKVLAGERRSTGHGLHVRYSALIFTYSALKSHVHIVAA